MNSPLPQALLALIAFCCISAWSETSETRVKESRPYALGRQACVEILVEDRHAGSGWIATKDGLIITAAHIVELAGRLQVLLPGTHERADARLVALDPGHDLALIEPSRPIGTEAFLRLSSRSLQTGQELWLFAAPVFRHGVLLDGRLARATPTFEYYPEQGRYIECFHVSGLSPRGASGGPWLDSRGEVVGLQSGSMTFGTALYGVAFISPLSAVRDLIQARTNVTTATLGVAIEETWQQDRAFLDALPPGTDGLVIRKLTPNGPAAEAGLKPWDIIVAAQGRPARLPDQLLRLVRSMTPGSELQLDVIEKGNATPRMVSVTLGSL